MNYITGGHIILFQSLLFFKKLVKAPTRAFIVFNYCSCVRFKLAINELVSLHCSSMPALNISFSSSFFTSSLALFLLIFLWVLFTFFCLRLQRSPLHCVVTQQHQHQSWNQHEQCDGMSYAISATEYFVDLLVEDGLFSISPTLVPDPNFRSLVTVYPVLHCLLAFVVSFLSTTFGA